MASTKRKPKAEKPKSRAANDEPRDEQEATANPVGAPSKYDRSFAAVARKLCSNHFTDAQLAEFFEVNPLTIYRWKAEHPEFSKAIARGKAATDDMVEASLFQRAVGYSHAATKIFMPAGAPAPVYAPYIEHHPPDTTAQRLWLINRRPKEWRDKQGEAAAPPNPEMDAARTRILALAADALEEKIARMQQAQPALLDVTPKKVNGSGNGQGH